jgi:hypothetical protein
MNANDLEAPTEGSSVTENIYSWRTNYDYEHLIRWDAALGFQGGEKYNKYEDFFQQGTSFYGISARPCQRCINTTYFISR